MTSRARSALLLLLCTAAVGCAPAVATPTSTPSKGPAKVDATKAAKTSVDAGEMTRGAPKEELTWQELTPATLARAKAERKYIVLDGSAEWCHWCHVMEAETYHDANVRKILDASFIAVKVDVDSRPDIEERYGDYGWPATVIFSPDATELGKYRGFIEPEKFTEILKEVVASGAASKTGAASATAKVKAPRTPLAEETLAWIQRAVAIEMDDYWDTDEGGWGRQQKAPIGWNSAWMLLEGKRDEAAKKKAIASLDAQSKLLDPVWGGIYQYSAARDWDSPHFEKLMTFQAPALDNYARAYELTKDDKQLARARAMLGYLDRFMKGADGGFYTTQDADLNAHDRTKPFLDGHLYYAKNAQDRLAAGIPRIDAHEYGRENGLAIAAYCTMYEVTKDPSVLASAEKAAKRILDSHKTDRGGITHDVVGASEKKPLLYLSDNAAFGLALVRLFEVTRNDEYLKRARAIADFLIADLTDDDGGGMFASSVDPDAVGIFSARRVPFEDNVMALRFFGHLAHATKDNAKLGVAIDRMLRATMTPEGYKGRGRFLGDVLLALEETKGVRGGTAR